MKKDALKVVIATERALHYSCVLRGTMPLEHLSRKGLVNYGHFSFDPENPDLPASLDACDLVLVFALGDTRWSQFTQYLQREHGKKVVVDFDDDLWDVSPMNFAYEGLGTREVPVNYRDKDGTLQKKMLWMDGHSPNFWIQDNRLRLSMASEMARQADAITVSTKRLQHSMLEHNGDVRVMENCVDLGVWRTDVNRKHEGFRVGWQGGDSHRHDMYVVAEQLGRFLKDHPEATLVLSGTFIPELKEFVPVDRVEFHPWVNSEAYPYLMMTLGLDLGIAPLAHTRFNTRKSALKWLEYGAMGVPCFASAVPPYTDYIRHGEDGHLLENGDWYDALSDAYKRRGAVKALGRRAHDRVAKDFDIRKRCGEWLDAYTDIARGEPRFKQARQCTLPLAGGGFRTRWNALKA